MGKSLLLLIELLINYNFFTKYIHLTRYYRSGKVEIQINATDLCHDKKKKGLFYLCILYFFFVSIEPLVSGPFYQESD